MSKKSVSFRVFLTIAALLVSLMVPVFASEAGPYSVTFQYPFAGSKLSLYLVAKPTSKGEMQPTEDFKQYPVELSEKTAPATLMGYVLRDEIPPLATAVVTADKEHEGSYSATFSGLEAGIYLMVPEKVTIGNTCYTPSPVLVQLPARDDKGKLQKDVTVSGKFNQNDVTAYTSLSVVKVWKDSDGQLLKEHPDSIRVQLLKDGVVVETVTLNSNNNWSYVWEKLDAGCNWTLVEESTAEGYRVSMSEDKKGCVVMVNTRKTPPPPGHKPPDEIPKTGQLWWPVSFLALGGICFLMIGFARRKRS